MTSPKVSVDLESPQTDSPEGWAEIASRYERDKKWLEAAKCWNNARIASIGHGRRERYYRAANRCRAEFYIQGAPVEGELRQTAEEVNLLTNQHHFSGGTWSSVDHKETPDKVIEEVNRLLGMAGTPLRFLNVNCGDDQYYFGLINGEQVPVTKGRNRWE